MTDPISAEAFSILVGLIYDCAIDPARWPVAMEAIRRELDFHNATVDLVLLPSGTVLSNFMCNVPQRYQPLMVGAGPDVVEQWGGAEVVRTLPLDLPAVLTRVNPRFDPDTTTSDYFNSFAKPQGIIDVMVIGLARDAGAMGTMSFGRHHSAGPIGQREMEVARLLVPHLQRAATINRMLEGMTVAQDEFAKTLDALTVPVILVDAGSYVLYANTAAERLFHRGTLIQRIAGRFDVTAPGLSNAAALAITEAARDESSLGRKGLGIPLTGRDGGTGALHVLPLDRRRPHVAPHAVAALFVAETDAPFVAPTEMAAALFGLTAAEARVFEYLVTGHTQADTAKALGVEMSTVKTHLTRLYDKIGVRRQADLVRVAGALGIPISA